MRNKHRFISGILSIGAALFLTIVLTLFGLGAKPALASASQQATTPMTHTIPMTPTTATMPMRGGMMQPNMMQEQMMGMMNNMQSMMANMQTMMSGMSMKDNKMMGADKPGMQALTGMMGMMADMQAMMANMQTMMGGGMMGGAGMAPAAPVSPPAAANVQPGSNAMTQSVQLKDIEVKATPTNLKDPHELAFTIDLNASGVDLSFDLAKQATLNVGDLSIPASAWEVALNHGHHVNGVLKFAHHGKVKLAAGDEVTIVIKHPNGTDEATLRWSAPAE